MKSLIEYIRENETKIASFIKENKDKFPITLFDVEDRDDAYEEDMKSYLNECTEKSGVKSVVYYDGPKGASSKRNTGLTLDSAHPADMLYFWEQIVSKADKGYVITQEDDYTLGVAFKISGPLPTPKNYIRFSKLEVEDIEDNNKDPKFPGDFVKIDDINI